MRIRKKSAVSRCVLKKINSWIWIAGILELRFTGFGIAAYLFSMRLGSNSYNGRFSLSRSTSTSSMAILTKCCNDPTSEKKGENIIVIEVGCFKLIDYKE